jgi:hypothetical protein
MEDDDLVDQFSSPIVDLGEHVIFYLQNHFLDLKNHMELILFHFQTLRSQGWITVNV